MSAVAYEKLNLISALFLGLERGVGNIGIIKLGIIIIRRHPYKNPLISKCVTIRIA